MDHTQAFELIPLYALDALEYSERTTVESHLADCESCRAELDRHQSVAAGLVDDSPAPAHVWDRIESAIGPEEGAVVHDLEAERQTRRAPMATWLLSAAAVVAAVFGGILIGQQVAENDLGTDAAVVAAAEAAADEPGSLVREFLVDDVSVARVVVTKDGVGYVIPTDQLEALTSDRTYQLWVITPNELVISAGVLGNDPGPATFAWNTDIAGFALTNEVSGGVVSSEGELVSLIAEA